MAGLLLRTFRERRHLHCAEFCRNLNAFVCDRDQHRAASTLPSWLDHAFCWNLIAFLSGTRWRAFLTSWSCRSNVIALLFKPLSLCFLLSQGCEDMLACSNVVALSFERHRFFLLLFQDCEDFDKKVEKLQSEKGRRMEECVDELRGLEDGYRQKHRDAKQVRVCSCDGVM